MTRPITTKITPDNHIFCTRDSASETSVQSQLTFCTVHTKDHPVTPVALVLVTVLSHRGSCCSVVLVTDAVLTLAAARAFGNENPFGDKGCLDGETSSRSMKPTSALTFAPISSLLFSGGALLPRVTDGRWDWRNCPNLKESKAAVRVTWNASNIS